MAATVLELRQQRGKILGEMKQITALAKQNGGRFTADQRKTLDGLKAQDDGILAEINEAEKDEELCNWVNKRDEELGLTLGRHIEPTTPANGTDRKGFSDLGHQLQAVASAALNPHERYHKDLVYDRFTEKLAPTGASEGAPSDGGFLVQRDFSAELLKRTYDYGEILNRVRSIPISANANGLRINAIDETSRVTGSRWGGVQVYWQNEADSPTAKKPKFRQMELNLKKLIGLCYATDELLQDAAALEAVVMQAFSEEFSWTLENGILNGTGAGQLLGFLNSGAVVSVAKVTGQASQTIVQQNIFQMWSRMWGRSRQNAIWLINQDVEPQLYALSQAVGTGGLPVYLPPGGMSQSPYSQLLGRPVIPVEYCATLGSVGDIILLDPTQYIMIDKGKMQSASSIHVRFINDESVFRFVYRTDGQPTWHSVLTPASGSGNTLAPCVTLAAR